MRQDLHNNIAVRRAISPVSGATSDAASVGQIIDHAGWSDIEYIIALGNLADVDATFTVLLEHGNDSGLSDAAAVPDADLIGTESGAGFRFDDDNEVRKLGYKGNKRYTRLTITPASNTGAWLHSAVCVMANPRKAPNTTQEG